MAKRKKPANLKPDALVEELVPDPSQPQARLVSGYLGKSARAGQWRVYLSLEFGEYLEIAEQDILQVVKLGREGSEAGAWVWVKHGASVEHVRLAPRRVQAEFLQGDITSAFLFGAAGQAATFFRGLAALALPKTFSVTECATCPTDDGSHTCVPAVCTLATSCLTTVPTDPGCGAKFI